MKRRNQVISSIAVKQFSALVLAAAAIGWTGTAAAAKANPEAAVVAKLYKDFAWQAMAGQPDLFGKYVSHLDKSALEQYFDPALTELLLKDATCSVKYQGICNLDFDLLFASQDPLVSDLEITTVAPGKVSVTFINPVDQKKTKIDFKIKRIGGAPKIADVIYRMPDPSSLVKMLSHKIP
jgi:hypothetical protein